MNSKPVILTVQVFIPMLEKAYLLSVICQKVKLVKVEGIANSKKLKIMFLMIRNRLHCVAYVEAGVVWGWKPE